MDRSQQFSSIFGSISLVRSQDFETEIEPALARHRLRAMGDIPEHIIPIIAGWFFVSTAIAGICFYCCYFKTRKRQNKTSGRSRNSVHRSYGEYGKSGQFSFYSLHSNPFLYYGGPAPCELSETSLTMDMESERNLNSPRYFEEKHCNKLPEKKHICRSTSYDKTVRSTPCHLQVITEAEEENEEEGKNRRNQGDKYLI